MLPPESSPAHGSLTGVWLRSCTMTCIGWMFRSVSPSSCLQAVHDSLQVSARLGTEVPRRPLRPSRRSSRTTSTSLCQSRTSGPSSFQHVKLRPTCVFVRRPSHLEFTTWSATNFSLFSYVQTLTEDIFIWADYAFSALETILNCLMGYISVLSNSNSNIGRMVWN